MTTATALKNSAVDHVQTRLAETEDRLLEGPASRTWHYPYTDPRTVLVPAVWDGVRRLISDYARLRPDGLVAVAWTPDARSATSWLVAELEEQGHRPLLVPMRPILDDAIEARLANVLGAVAREDLTLFTLETHTMSHSAVLRPLAAQGATVVRAIGAGTDLFTQGLSMAPVDLDLRNRALWSHIGSSERIRVTTSGGTDLTIGFDHDAYRWVSNAGLHVEASFIVVPSGEIATYSTSVSGTFVADFAIHTNEPCPFDTRLGSCPVAIEIENSCVVGIETAHAGIRSYLEAAFAEPDAYRIGEVGFGTNLGVVEAIDGNSHVNERNAGLHLGIGQHNQSRSVVPYSCKTHIDLIAGDGHVTTDNGVTIDLRGPIEAAAGADTKLRPNQRFSTEDVTAARV